VTDTDTDESADDAAFRAEVRAFLESVAKHKSPGTAPHPMRSTDTSRTRELEHVEASRRWMRTLAEHGWAGIAWPVEYGGRGLTAKHMRMFVQEQLRFDVPYGTMNVSVDMVGPTIMAHGTEEQKHRFLPKILTGEHVWCQLYSEPGAGSDLAGLTTRAERDGEEWIVNGQKVWNSGAHYSDWGILLTRTNWDVPKHRGITYFLVDMKTPGIEVRPLKQITGHAHFNETFLSDVRIPHANVLGDVDDGWRVAQTTLAHERNMIGGGGVGTTFGDILDVARRFDRDADAVARQRLAECYTRFELLKWLGQRARAAAARGKALGPEASVLKLFLSTKVARDADLVLELVGANATLSHGDAPDKGAWQQAFLGQFGIRIGGGTEEIQRNVLGERVLGLPSDVRVDKNVPFRDVPKNASR
jgi:alkylation response protein AidB-like acyl-CoA dehydrogenase